jgi:hypothetical protein
MGLDMPNWLLLDPNRFNDEQWIESRIARAPENHRGPLRTAFSYLYNDHGPINLPRDRLLISQEYLDEAEKIVIRWLYTRTNGSLRKSYGASALKAARTSRYRCEDCGCPDVRVLNLDHVQGHCDNPAFRCLCANCHTIKSRDKDWTENKREEEIDPEE